MSGQLRFTWAFMLFVFVFLSCHRYPHIGEPLGKYSILDASHAEDIVVVRAIERSRPIGRVTWSFRTGRYTQVWKARVEIENVLQGQLPHGPVDVFYLMRDDIPGSSMPLVFVKGERDILFLEKDGLILRTICDSGRNCCARTVLTGAHPNFVRPPMMTIEQAITAIALTRGLGPDGKPVDDHQMIRAIHEFWPFWSDPNKAVLKKTLKQLESNETPLVGEAACAALRQLGDRCGTEMEFEALNERPVVRIKNLTNQKQTIACRPGDRIRITIAGASHEHVYKSNSDGRHSSTVLVGTTDRLGRFVIEEVLPEGNVFRTEVWSVGQREASPALTYSGAIAAKRTRIVTTVIGDPRDSYGGAVSAISASGKTVLGYFGVELSYPASLYYDLQPIATLFRERKPVRSVAPLGTISVAGLLEAPAAAMNDYTMATKEYASAVFFKGSFQNPLRFADGSCFGTSDNCEIVPVAGPEKSRDRMIPLGRTAADQTSMLVFGDHWFKHFNPNSKQSIIQVRFDQQPTPAPTAVATVVNPLSRVALPKYSIYAQFLRAVQLLASTGRRVDEENWLFLGPDRTDQPKLHAIEKAANSFDVHIAALDRHASLMITDFRNRAKSQLDRGKPMPDAPENIYTLQALRVAAEIQQMIALKRALGSEGSAWLEAFLGREFTSGGEYEYAVPPSR